MLIIAYLTIPVAPGEPLRSGSHRRSPPAPGAVSLPSVSVWGEGLNTTYLTLFLRAVSSPQHQPLTVRPGLRSEAPRRRRETGGRSSAGAERPDRLRCAVLGAGQDRPGRTRRAEPFPSPPRSGPRAMGRGGDGGRLRRRRRRGRPGKVLQHTPRGSAEGRRPQQVSSRARRGRPGREPTAGAAPSTGVPLELPAVAGALQRTGTRRGGPGGARGARQGPARWRRCQPGAAGGGAGEARPAGRQRSPGGASAALPGTKGLTCAQVI